MHNKKFGKKLADNTQHQLLFCYCAGVVGRDETLFTKKILSLTLNKNQQQFGQREFYYPHFANLFVSGHAMTTDHRLMVFQLLSH